MLAADGAAVGRSSKNVFMMDVSLWRTCGTPFSRHHIPPPDHSSWKWSSCTLQTVLTLLWRTNAFLGTFVILRLHIVHQSPFASLTTNHFTVFMEAFYSCLKQSIQRQKSFFGVMVSLKDVCPAGKKDNTMPALCVFLAILKSKNSLFFQQYEHIWISLLGSLFLQKRSRMRLHWCIKDYGRNRTFRE